jgi:hypothetical protein
VPGLSEASIRAALAYIHCDDLDNPELVARAPEARTAAIDALVRGYLARRSPATCAECEEPIPPGEGVRAHTDCDNPLAGLAGPAEGYKPSGLALTL